MKIKENIILLPFDFTDVATSVANHAAGVAKLLNYELCLLHIINKDTKAELKKEKLGIETIFDKLKTISSDIEAKHNVKTSFITRQGSIFTAIGEVAKEIGANLVILPTHGRKGIQHIVGSYAFKVVTSSPVPVIVVKKDAKWNGYKNIVLPLDDSLESKQKVKWAIYIASKFNSTINIIVVNEPNSVLKTKVDKNTEQIKRVLKENNISYTIKLADKIGVNFSKQVMEYSNKINADLVIIMTKTTDKLMPDFILTTWAERIIAESEIPVMCINPLDVYFIITG